jgi:flagellar motor switch protein FliM
LAGAERTSEDRTARTFDWRRPSKFARDHVRSLAVAHEVFSRRLASGLGNALGALVQLEPVSVGQVSYDDYVRSLPNPDVLGMIAVPPLPGSALLELNVQLSLQMVDRMLGGHGAPLELRRPTELETDLLRDLMGLGVAAVGAALRPLVADVAPTLVDIQYNPQVVQIAAPSDMVLLFAFRLSIAAGAANEGLLTLCYPAATLAPVLDSLAAAGERAVDGELAAAGAAAVAATLQDTQVDLSVRLRDSLVSARDLSALRVGDVLRLDHRIDDPVLGYAGGSKLLAGRLGTRRRRLAYQIEGWRPDEEATGAPLQATR